MKNKKIQQGFTLIEVLVVIGIIAILAVIVLIAINPARQFALSRNTQRTANVNAILNAIGQNMVDNKGVFTCSTATAGLPNAASTVANSVSVTTAKVDLGCLVPTYIASLPFDPSTTTPVAYYSAASDYNTGYTVLQDSTTQRVTVCAPTLETSVGNSEICVTR